MGWPGGKKSENAPALTVPARGLSWSIHPTFVSDVPLSLESSRDGKESGFPFQMSLLMDAVVISVLIKNPETRKVSNDHHSGRISGFTAGNTPPIISKAGSSIGWLERFLCLFSRRRRW